MPNHTRTALALAAVNAIALAGDAAAAPTLYAVAFDVVFASDESPTIFDGLPVQVEAQFEFDPSVLDPDETQEFTPLPVTSFSSSLNPIGATTFDTTNVVVQIVNVDGDMSLAIGGIENGTSGIGTEDFIFVLENPFDLNGSGSTPTFRHADIVLANGDKGTTDLPGGNGTATFEVVPEPSSLALLGLGGLLFTRRRR